MAFTHARPDRDLVLPCVVSGEAAQLPPALRASNEPPESGVCAALLEAVHPSASRAIGGDLGESRITATVTAEVEWQVEQSLGPGQSCYSAIAPASVHADSLSCPRDAATPLVTHSLICNELTHAAWSCVNLTHVRRIQAWLYISDVTCMCGLVGRGNDD